MAIVTRRYRFRGPTATELTTYVGGSAAPNANFVPNLVADLQYDNAISGAAATLDEYMSRLGWEFDATAVPGGMLAGTVGAPGLPVAGSPTTGFYSPAANELAIALGGVQVVHYAAGALSFKKAVRAEAAVLAYGANVAIDASLANFYTLTLTGATAQLNNPTNLQAGMSWTIAVSQDATGGRNLTYGTFYSWGVEGAPTLSTSTSGLVDVLSFFAFSSTKIACTALRGYAP